MGTHTQLASPPRVLPRATRRRAVGADGDGVGVPAKHAPVLAALGGIVVWLIVDPRTPDLAGQVYRAALFHEVGFAVWDLHWYGGHHLLAYSLLFPPLGALLGVRVVGALAVAASTLLFGRVVEGSYGPRARWGAVWFALAALGDVWSGRVTFALGVSVALGATLAFARGRTALAALLAAVCAVSSPVAAALLALAGLTQALAARAPRGALILGVPGAAVVLALSALFPEGGWEPYPLLSFLATAAAVVAFLLALPRAQRLLRVGALLYLVSCVGCVAVHTPVGANVERYGVLLGGPLLVCALGDDGALARGIRSVSRALRGAVVALALVGLAVWTAWGPVRETAAVAGERSTAASYYAPVERFVAAHGGSRVRIEVPFTRGHWEAAWLAPRVALARGWEKQLDERYDGVLLAKHLSAASYGRWLRAEAVAYVALPDAPLDPSSAREGALIRRGLPYLQGVLRTAHWRIYAVRDATPLARGPGVLTGTGHDWFALRARAPGRFVVRVRYTRYWTVESGTACVGAAPGGWTAVIARAAGAVRVAASFSLGRALGGGGGVSCAAGAGG